MNLQFLCWYNSFLCLVLSVLTLVVSVMPESQWVQYQTFKIFLILAVVFAVVGFYLHRKPPDHWAHRSRPLLVLGWVAASLFTLLVLLVG